MAGQRQVGRMPCLPRASASHGRPEERLLAVPRPAASRVLRFAAPLLPTPAPEERVPPVLPVRDGSPGRSGGTVDDGMATPLRYIRAGSSTEQCQSAQSTASARAPQICRMRVSANRPSRSTRTATETLSTESMLTTQRRGTGSSPGSRPTSLTREPRAGVKALRAADAAAIRDACRLGARVVVGAGFMWAEVAWPRHTLSEAPVMAEPCRGPGPPGRRRSRPHEPEHDVPGRRGGAGPERRGAAGTQETVVRTFRACCEAMKSRMTGYISVSQREPVKTP